MTDRDPIVHVLADGRMFIPLQWAVENDAVNLLDRMSNYWRRDDLNIDGWIGPRVGETR